MRRRSKVSNSWKVNVTVIITVCSAVQCCAVQISHRVIRSVTVTSATAATILFWGFTISPDLDTKNLKLRPVRRVKNGRLKEVRREWSE